MTIKLGLHVKPLPPMRDARQIVIDALAAIKGGIALTGGHVRGLVDFRHPDGQDRACEAVAILAHLCADRNPNGLKEVFDVQRREQKKRERSSNAIASEIMTEIYTARERTIAAGGVFTVSDIKPIIEKALS